MGFEKKVAVEFWVKTCICECAELQEAEGKEQHGSSTRTVQVRRANPTFRTRVSCTGRAREKWFRTGQLHGPCLWFRLSTGLQHGACSRGVCADFQCSTGRADQHGPCPIFGLHGSRKASARGVSSLFSARGVRIGTGHSRFCTGPTLFARVVQFSLLLR